MTDATDGTISIVVGESHSDTTLLPTKLQQQKVFTSKYVLAFFKYLTPIHCLVSNFNLNLAFCVEKIHR